MRSRTIAVLGAGTAGLSASLALARDGHRVVLIERDLVHRSAPEQAFAWERKGIAHFLQPHALIPRGRHELIEHFGDVYASLIRAGAHDIDVGRKLPGSPEPADAALQYIAVRRPLLEWGLRTAVLAQPGIEVASGAAVTGVRLEDGSVRRVEADGRVIDVDLAIDAMGRRSPMRGWLERQGHALPAQRRSDCGVIYYSRYYRVRSGSQLPDGPWLLGPRGDLGYMGFTTFPGDNGTFAVVFAVPTGVPEIKCFMREAVFEAAVARIPLLAAWADPALVEAITPVLPMGGLMNTINASDEAMPGGWVAVADALCHTDPVLAHGLSFSLIHAIEIARALRAHDDPADAIAAYADAVMPALLERYAFATALDEQRHRMWIGAPVDFSRHDADYALFSVVAAGAVAMADAEVFRVFVRRLGLLDSTRVLDEDEVLQRRIEDRFRELLARPRPATGPTRDEMLALASDNVPPPC